MTSMDQSECLNRNGFDVYLYKKRRSFLDSLALHTRHVGFRLFDMNFLLLFLLGLLSLLILLLFFLLLLQLPLLLPFLFFFLSDLLVHLSQLSIIPLQLLQIFL